MPRRPPYSQHFSRALGSPAALVVLSLHVALGPVLQRACHIALHHIGTVAPRGKHSETPSPPAPADSSALAIQPAPRQACLPLTLPVRSLWGGRSWRDTPPPPPACAAAGEGGITHPTHRGQGQQWGNAGSGNGTKSPSAQLVAGCTGKGQAGAPGLARLGELAPAPGVPVHPSFDLPSPDRLQEPPWEPALPSPASCPLGARVPALSNEEPFPCSGWVRASPLG